ncbi:glycerate kinase [Propionimicrobium sp. PCR01-08-3]|uniref:glycerate kinase n=1 Tax=Propionimicrobium sp. PCR01-08-3 TaxID=3052086 RepID=UPI00255CB2ED|nr:glycerate kinase [Propionimicrobium sp. PCR01-08-3]WIY81657.1 glycerate kinase [Propionimicrobium sp. PCR01-08-3]
MKVVLAPDSFKESMSAAHAAAAMSRGVRSVFPDAQCVEVPMADGGEGTTDALVAVLGGEFRQVSTVDALGRPIQAVYGLDPGGLAIIEVATAVGLGQIKPDERDVLRSTSSGVADVIVDALDAGATTFIIGLGGSATTDCGAGMLAGLGARWLAADGSELTPDPTALADLDRVDLSGLDPRLGQVTIELACDVTNPLLGPDGSAAVFGPQKGATPDDVGYLDGVLEKVANALVAAGTPDVRDVPGAGAAGGLGAAFLAIGAELRRGAEIVAEAAHLDEAVEDADLVLTGEGGMDFQTRSGKTPAGVAEVAARHDVPVIAFAGTLGRGVDDLVGQTFDAVIPITTGPGTLDDALRQGPANLERAVASTMRVLRLGGWLLG